MLPICQNKINFRPYPLDSGTLFTNFGHELLFLLTIKLLTSSLPSDEVSFEEARQNILTSITHVTIHRNNTKFTLALKS